MNRALPLLTILLLTGCWSRDNPVDPGRCTPRCASGLTCVNGACVTTGLPPASDATADTASFDAAQKDAAPSDARRDAATDRGLPDLPPLPTCQNGWISTTSGVSVPLTAVWGSSPLDVYAVGDAGTVVHFNGYGWSDLTAKVGTTKNLTGVWGSGAKDVYVVGAGGTVIHWDGSAWSDLSSTVGTTQNLTGVWGTSASDLYVYGAGSTLIHSDGKTWTAFSPKPMGDVTSIWGTSPSTLYARMGPLFQTDGTKWTVQAGAPSSFYPMFRLWGSGAGDIYEVGGTTKNGGIISHFDGAAWTMSMISGTPPFHGVAGDGPAAVFVVGESGHVRFFDGVAWIQLTSGTLANLAAVWVGGGEAFIVGSAGTILRYVLPWKAQASGTSNMLRDVWGSGPSDIFAVGLSGTVAHYDGSKWAAGTWGTSNLAAVWGSGPSDVFAASPGDYGSIPCNILHYDSTKQWTAMPGISPCTGIWSGGGPQALWGTSGSDVFAGGGWKSNSWMRHYDSAAWSAMPSAEVGPYKYWYGIWGKGGKDVYAVGELNTTGYPGVIWHYDGTSWTADSTFTLTTSGLRGIWGTTGLTVAVGLAGTIVSNTGSGWTAMTSSTSQDLLDVWGSGTKDVFAVGAKGAALHYDGTAWTPLPSGVSAALRGVWGSGAKDVYAVGDGGTILHHCLP